MESSFPLIAIPWPLWIESLPTTRSTTTINVATILPYCFAVLIGKRYGRVTITILKPGYHVSVNSVAKRERTTMTKSYSILAKPNTVGSCGTMSPLKSSW